MSSLTDQKIQKMQLIHQQKINKVEYVLALLILFVAGFLGSQKMINSLQNEDSAINIHKLSSASCRGGFRLPGIHCQSSEPKLINEGAQHVSQQTDQIEAKIDKRMVIPLKGQADKSLGEQLAQ